MKEPLPQDNNYTKSKEVFKSKILKTHLDLNLLSKILTQEENVIKEEKGKSKTKPDVAAIIELLLTGGLAFGIAKIIAHFGCRKTSVTVVF